MPGTWPAPPTLQLRSRQQRSRLKRVCGLFEEKRFVSSALGSNSCLKEAIAKAEEERSQLAARLHEEKIATMRKSDAERRATVATIEDRAVSTVSLHAWDRFDDGDRFLEGFYFLQH